LFDLTNCGLLRAPKENPVSIAVDVLKAERENLKELLRTIEAEQRKVEAELKAVRQRELRTKREIEALSTLIELAESASKEGGEKSEASEGS
jgi:predicted  nucleic acid-binding Zn-ribbon protein